MNFLLHRKGNNGTGGLSGMVPVGYTGVLSSLGLVDGDPLNLTNVGETWLNDLTASPQLSQVTLGASLYMDTSRVQTFTATGIHITNGGGLYGGTATTRMPRGTNIVLNGAPPGGRVLGADYAWNGSTYILNNNPNDGGGLSRAIMVDDGGHLELYGQDSGGLENTVLAADAATSATVLSVVGLCNWKAGDQITVGMSNMLTSLSQTNHTTVHTLASDASYNAGTNISTLTLTSGLTYARCGRVQYGTGAGMSWTNDGYTAANLLGHVSSNLDVTARTALAAEINAAIAAGRPNVLDQRAPITRITRGCKISAPNDTYFSGSERFGVHTMKMGFTGTYIIDNMEIANCGQGGARGRYPVHYHANSIVPNTGTNYGNVAAGSHVVNRCGIHNSHNRGTTMHAIWGSKVTNNTYHDIKGHCIFLEDGSEQNNTITGNFVSYVRPPGVGYTMKDHDNKASGFWCSNTQNIVKNNRFSDGFHGRWVSVPDIRFGFPGGCFGLSSQQAIEPKSCQVQDWSDNISHSNYSMGARVFTVVTDESGIFNGSAGGIESRDNDHATGTRVPSSFLRETLYLNNGSGATSDVSGNSSTGNYDNRVSDPRYTGWVVADCCGSDFSGATNFGLATDLFMIGKSLNKDPAQDTTTLARNGFATYHGLLTFKNSTAINYQPGNLHSQTSENYGFIRGDSVMESWDLYIEPSELLAYNNTGFAFIDSLSIWRSPGFSLVNHTTTYSLILGQNVNPMADNSLSCAFLDYDGRIGGVNRPESWVMYDQPVFTTDVTDLVSPYMPGGTVPSYTKVTAQPMYGLVLQAMSGLPQTTVEGTPRDPSQNGGFTYQRASNTTLVDVSGAKLPFNQSTDAQITLPSRIFAVPKGGALRLTRQPYAADGAAAQFSMLIYQMVRSVNTGWASNDYFYLGIPWPNAAAEPSNIFIGKQGVGNGGNPGYYPGAVGVYQGWVNSATPVASKAALLALTNRVFHYWRDTTNNIIWVRVVHGWDGYDDSGTPLPGNPDSGYAALMGLKVPPTDKATLYNRGTVISQFGVIP